MNDRAWKTKDVAEFLQASESWVRHAAAEGRLPCIKIGGLLRFDPSEIRALVEGHRRAPPRVLSSGT
jgi:excisionase family DNA binding protein